MDDLHKELDARFAQLPKIVQDAITSAEVEKHLQALAQTHKLHIDQWEALENEVMLVLLGITEAEELTSALETEVKVSHETAVALADSISHIVFEPVRASLEKELQKGGGESGEAPEKKKVTPSTPPTPKQTPIKAPRAAFSETYRSGEASTDRKTVHDDPYRESPL